MKTVKLGDILLKTSNIKWKDISSEENFDYIDLTSVDRTKHSIGQTAQINPRTAPSRAQKIVLIDDVIFGITRPTLNRLCIIPKEYDSQICSTGFCVLRANKKEILPVYIYYLLTTPEFYGYIEKLQRGASYPAVTDTDVKNFEFYLPSLEEQKQIVKKLDGAFEKIDRAIELTQKNLQNSKDLFDAELNAQLKNPIDGSSVILGNVITLQRGFDLPRKSRIEGQYMLTSSSGVIDTHNKFKAKGPGVYTGRSGSVGNTFYEEKDFWPLNTTLYVKDFHGNNVRYCYWLLKSIDLKKYAGGTGVPTLNRNNVHGISVELPNKREQQLIAKQLDELYEKAQKLQNLYQEKLQKLEQLKQSMLQEAFQDGAEV